MWFIGVEVEQEKSAPPPKKNPGSAPDPYSVDFLRSTHSQTKSNKNALKHENISLAPGSRNACQNKSDLSSS